MSNSPTRHALVIPVLACVLLRPQVGSDAVALAIAGVVPAAWAVARFAWQRRVDPNGLLAVAGFGIAVLVAALSGGNSLQLKVRDAPLIGAIGVAFLLSAAVRKPLLPPLLRLLGRDGLAPSRRLTLATVVVGATLIVDAVTRLTLALTLQTSTFLAVNHEVSWSIVGAGLALLWLTGRHVAPRSSDPVTPANLECSSRPNARVRRSTEPPGAGASGERPHRRHDRRFGGWSVHGAQQA